MVSVVKLSAPCVHYGITLCTYVLLNCVYTVQIFTLFVGSDLSVTTRHRSASVGTRLEYDKDGRIRNKTICAREVR